MVDTTSAALIAAAEDNDLYERIVALAAQAGHSEQDVRAMRRQIVAANVSDNGDTVASVYQYALLNYEPKPTPGEDPSAVTDDQIRYAIDQILGVEG